MLQRAVRAAGALAPAVDVQGKLLSGPSVAAAVLEASEGAALLVVETKGYGPVKETLGSTAHAVLHHARGPGLVSRHTAG
ncbi:MAG: universal stress protein [Pseudarthrobacter sp.]|nr:universal stress protein [Pseudarthrobacter sp.]